MSNSTQLIKQRSIEVFVPAIIVFCGLVAGGTCIATKPFFPIGVSGIVIFIGLILLSVYYLKAKKYVDELNSSFNKLKEDYDLKSKVYAKELEKRDVAVEKLTTEIGKLQAEIAELKKKVIDDVVPEPVPPVVKKSSKKK